MRSYRQSLDLGASPATVYAALTTAGGLRGWWTQDCDVPGEIGRTVQVRFGNTFKDLRIEALEPGRQVRWMCTRAHVDVDHITHKNEWVGTEIIFRLEPTSARSTRLEFEHLGLVPSFECFDICTAGWQQFLGSLQQFVETGHGTPYAHAAQVAS